MFSLSVSESYLSSSELWPSFGSGGWPIEPSIFKETQLGPGESALCCCSGLQHNTQTQFLLRLMMVSWCITSELWDEQQSQIVGDLLWLLDVKPGQTKHYQQFEGPQVFSSLLFSPCHVWSIESDNNQLFWFIVCLKLLPLFFGGVSIFKVRKFILAPVTLHEDIAGSRLVCCLRLDSSRYF